MDFSGWKWLNESRMMLMNGELAIAAPAETDWFNNPVPENGSIQAPVANAPFFYTEVKGDFVFRARVRPNHRYESPAGEGGLRFFSDVSLENRTVENLRKGI